MTEFLTLRTVDEAWALFQAHFSPALQTERVQTADALGRTLAQEVRAAHALPDFVRSTVDGYAVQATDTHGAGAGMPAYLDVIGEAAMGAATGIVLAPGQAALVHTGGMVPGGADAVVMIEYTHRAGPPLGPVVAEPGFEAHSIEVYRPVAGGENCIQVGEDVQPGDLVMEARRTLRPAEIGGLLALGVTEITVARQPRVGILSQGDEVVLPEQEPAPGQVRDINSYTLAGLTVQAGGIPRTYPLVPDQLEALQSAARRAFDENDLVVLTAGSSVSYRDLTAQVIHGLGRPGVLVHGVSVRPGKPSILAMCDGKPVFGLPGNPVSCINIFRLFVSPAIRQMLGAGPLPACRVQARLGRNIGAASGRTDYVRVRLEERNGETWAVPVFGKSNLIYTLVRSEGSIEVPLNSNGIAEGSWVTVTID